MAWPLPVSVCPAVMLGRKYVASSQLKPLALFTAYLVGCSLLILCLGQILAHRHYPCAGLAGSGRDLLLFDHLRDGHLYMQMIHPTDTIVSLKQRPTSVPPCVQRSVIFFTTSVATCYILPWVSWTHHLGHLLWAFVHWGGMLTGQWIQYFIRLHGSATHGQHLFFMIIAHMNSSYHLPQSAYLDW